MTVLLPCTDCAQTVSCRVAIIYIISFPFALHSHTVSDSHIQDCAPTVHRLCADRVVWCHFNLHYVLHFCITQSHCIWFTHTGLCSYRAPTVRRPCRVAIIYIMPFPFALHSHTVANSHIQDCAPTVLRPSGHEPLWEWFLKAIAQHNRRNVLYLWICLNRNYDHLSTLHLNRTQREKIR